MTEKDEKPVEGALPSEEEAQSLAAFEGVEPAGSGAADSIDETVEAASAAAAAAAAEADATMDAPAQPAPGSSSETGYTQAGAQEPASSVPAVAAGPTTSYEETAPKKPILDHLTEETEYDSDATNDDRIMAALAYGSQLIIPLLVPIIILISETSKKRPFQRYHAIQSIGVSIVVWALLTALTVLASISVATIVLWLCLCFIVPAMIMLWLLPLYYSILAYSGKRFTVPGLTQFLKDQRWL